jgi:hypothetical protein
MSCKIKPRKVKGKIRTAVIGKVYTPVPVNGDAARVMRPGEHFDSKFMRASMEVFDAPPTVVTPLPPRVEDLRGVRFGRFTVLGYHGAKRWVVRCACGMFALRRTKAIKNEFNGEDRCEYCRATFVLREGRLPNRTNMGGVS